jgi:hypothetical protein
MIDFDIKDGKNIQNLYKEFLSNSSYELEFRLRSKHISKYEKILTDKTYKEEVRNIIVYDNGIREININGNIEFQRKTRIDKYDMDYRFFNLRLALSDEEQVSDNEGGKIEIKRQIIRRIYEEKYFSIHLSDVVEDGYDKKELEFELLRETKSGEKIKLSEMLEELMNFIVSIYPGIPNFIKNKDISEVLDIMNSYNPPFKFWKKSYPQLQDITREDIKKGELDSSSVSNKLDGERMFIFSCRKGIFAVIPPEITDEHSFICLYFDKHNSNNTTILMDSEYDPNDYKFKIFDIYQIDNILTYRNNKFDISYPFFERYKLINESINKLSGIDDDIKNILIRKPFEICSDAKCNTYVNTLLTLRKMFDEYKTLDNIKKYNDGLVNQLRFDRNSKKYKFPENLTIDFEIKIIGEQYEGKSMCHRNSKRELIVDFLVPIGNERKDSFLKMIEKDYQCIQLENDNGITEWIDAKNGDVIEFGYKDNNFYPVRYRRKETGNFYKVALNIWDQISNPIYLEEYLKLLKEQYPIYKDEDKKLEKEILNKLKGSEGGKKKESGKGGEKCLVELRKYHNVEKRNILKNGIKDLSNDYSIFDIGSGRGGDLDKFWENDQSKLFKLYLLEPFSEHLNGNNGLYSRIKGLINKYRYNTNFQKRIENGTKVIPLKLDANSYDNIIKEVDNKVNLITSFFSLTFFFESDELLDLFVDFIDRLLVVDGLFIGACTDGEKLGKYIEKNRKDEKEEITLGSCISIYPEFKKLSQKCGDKIQIKLNTATVADYQTEYLIYFDKLVDKLKQKNIKLIKSNFFSPNLSDKDEQLYSSFHRSFVFKKGKEEKKEYNLLKSLTPGEIKVFKTVYSEDYTFVRIGTIGEGSCFFHSVYESIDPEYRKLSKDKKKKFIIKKREELVDSITMNEFLYYGDYLINNLLIFLNEQIEGEGNLVLPTIYPIMNIEQKLDVLSSYVEENKVLSRKKFDKFINKEYGRFKDKLKDCSEWVEYYALSLLQRKMNINFIIITDKYRDIYQTGNKYNYDNPFLIILNLDNTHYEAVGLLYENPDEEDNRKYLLERIFNINDSVIKQLLRINVKEEKKIATHNMFHYLNKFRNKVISIVESNSDIKKSSIEGMFIKWYLNSITYGSYIPNTFKIRRDLEFQSKRGKVNINKILNLVDEQIKILNNETSNVNKKYSYKNVFSDLQLKLLKKKYTGNINEFDQHLNFLSELYDFMKGFNNHLSTPPPLINNDWIELFGTPVNTKNKYCSPFKIEKDYFGSYGSFFDFNISDGTYIANPPFDEEIIERMAQRLIEQLSSNEKIDIIVIIPNWNDLNGYDLLVESKYLNSDRIIPKHFKFFNYYDNSFHPVVDCHIMLLSNYNTKFSLEEFILKWKQVK